MPLEKSKKRSNRLNLKNTDVEQLFFHLFYLLFEARNSERISLFAFEILLNNPKKQSVAQNFDF
jgi:hypothetical protein